MIANLFLSILSGVFNIFWLFLTPVVFVAEVLEGTAGVALTIAKWINTLPYLHLFSYWLLTFFAIEYSLFIFFSVKQIINFIRGSGA